MKLPRHFFVAGTDTGVGKTRISCALMKQLANEGHSVVGMKPIASGVSYINGTWMNEDVFRLQKVATRQTSFHLINPISLNQPISPNLAAINENKSIDLAHITDCYHTLTNLADCVVVEGVGGLLVPLSATEDGSDLCAALNIPIILVVGLRLGCLSHALLTVLAIQFKGLQLAGWVANHIEPTMAAQDENITYLQSHISAPLLMRMPYQADNSDYKTY
jgi:dethiobiotin synthetase